MFWGKGSRARVRVGWGFLRGSPSASLCLGCPFALLSAVYRPTTNAMPIRTALHWEVCPANPSAWAGFM